MFEEVHLQNFKCFGDVTFDLCSRNSSPKHLAIIFGENGSGKSNLASAFYFLSRSLQTMCIKDSIQALLYSDRIQSDDDIISALLHSSFQDIENLIQGYKMVQSEGPMLLEFSFNIDGNRGSYLIKTNQSRIIQEKLEYVLVHNKRLYFNISPDDKSINSKIFSSRSTFNEVSQSCEKYWGKHSLLSIIMHEIQDKSDDYLLNNLSGNLRTLLSFFERISCRLTTESTLEESIVSGNTITDFESGQITLSKEEQLNSIEEMLNSFFRSVSKDTYRVYYDRIKKESTIDYQLMQTKMINGKLRDISFANESVGIQSLLRILPFIIAAAKGSVAVIDEFDEGLHDVLVKDMVQALASIGAGQIIITLHSTAAMDSGIPKEFFYVIDNSKNGTHDIKSITKCKTQIRDKSSIRKQYVDGRFGGAPEQTRLDLNTVLSFV